VSSNPFFCGPVPFAQDLTENLQPADDPPFPIDSGLNGIAFRREFILLIPGSA
jgi:hypothetical protein